MRNPSTAALAACDDSGITRAVNAAMITSSPVITHLAQIHDHQRRTLAILAIPYDSAAPKKASDHP
ncbi:hypothetical protein Val02_31100 [Virgisporangium aliadipatigenens]|uniref:Uncharacterized protein n=1 Tax=Virgisporangium aliadipatigenens TaxID=741659 RepID=A0A8J4DQ50_9ACTN|nr:hypothetical protein Val02_31100 [Virgisporangium aliadipatigenens]